jgi:two-component system, NtrC family, sensor kinase
MTERVLIVDDSPQLRDFLAENIFQSSNFTVLMAHDGSEGLHIALSERPDLMIIDMQMPAMSGLDLLAALREQEVHIPAILITGFGSERTAVQAFRLGVRDYLIKPFEVEEMLTAVDRALRENRLKRERDRLLEKLKQSNQQLERRLQELNTVYSIGRSVSASLDLELVLHRVVEAAVYLTGAEEGYLMLLDQGSEELYMRASKNLDSQARSMRLRLQDSLAGRVMHTKRPLIINEDSGWQKIKTSYLVHSLIYVPLLFQNKAIGVLGVANRFKKSLFVHHAPHILATLADYAVLAIQNAQLYLEAQTRAKELALALQRQTETDRLKNEFTQNVSHELRTPVAIIAGYIELLQAGNFGPLESAQRETVATISRQLKLLRKILDDFSLILFVGEHNPQSNQQVVALAAIVEMIVEDYRATAGQNQLQLVVEIAPDLAPAYGDPIQLHRLLDNLVSNAMKFTAKGGTVTIRLRPQNNYLVLEVIDTGIGIPEEQLARITERFYQIDGSVTRRYGGVGLGLALVKEITEAHGGRLLVQSRVGQGSVFQVFLPAMANKPAKPPE